jgi:hypothetical protein
MSEGTTKYHVSSGRALSPAEIARLDEIEASFGDSVDIPEISADAWAAAPRRKDVMEMRRQAKLVPARS